MARRDGFYSIRKVAKEMCRLITVFAPVIKQLYPDSPALHAALEAALAACRTLHEELDANSESGV